MLSDLFDKIIASLRRGIRNLTRGIRFLLVSSSRYRGIFDYSFVGILFLDRSGLCREANDAALKLIGFEHQDLRGGRISWKALTPPEKRTLENLENVSIPKGACLPFEKELVRKDGSRAHVSVGMAELEAGGDTIVVFLLDLTETKKKEQLVAEQRSKMIAASKLSALGEMAGGIAHEINNPLAIIHGKANQLRRMAEAGHLQLPVVAETSRKIEDTAMRISRIVGGLRAFAREGDEDPVQVVKVVSIVDETLELCRAKFLHHDIDLRSSIPLELEVPCRPVQISQVLLSLLSNAHDAVLPLAEKWISIGAHPLDMWIDITVTDSGHGIPSEIREKVMQPFFTTKEVGRGTGLGLSSARGIAESHHGALFVDPESPHTRLVLRLPRAQAKPQAA